MFSFNSNYNWCGTVILIKFYIPTFVIKDSSIPYYLISLNKILLTFNSLKLVCFPYFKNN